MRLDRHVFLVSAVAFLYGALPAFGADMAPGPAVSCLDKSQLNNKLNPFDLWNSIAACLICWCSMSISLC